MTNDHLYWRDKGGYFRTYVQNDWTNENAFVGREPAEGRLPDFGEARGLLPSPVWDGHEDALSCYWRSWEIAFRNLRKPVPGSGFISDYIDPAFNGNMFMWDSVFMLMFGVYGNRAFRFQGTLDNFYAKQHPDGFICREINEESGDEQFHRYDPSSTGPNLLAWSEWTYYRLTGDRGRLGRVFPVIAGYHRWMKYFRTWQDGSYYSSGWGCGMDNQPRIRQHLQFEFFHGHMSWIDTTLQQLLSARLLLRMAVELGRQDEALEFERELAHLSALVNDKHWDAERAFYVDRHQDGSLSDVMTIGSFWALLAEAVPEERLAAFAAHLSDPASFNRPHRVPTLAACSAGYEPGGDYWRGSVWAPTNYMVLKGLEHVGLHGLAHEIAVNHFESVLQVYRDTGTLWENYAPERIERGQLAAPEFVGWTGVSTISVLLEFVFGLKPFSDRGEIVWDIRLADRHGVERYPFGKEGVVTLLCDARSSVNDRPVVHARSSVPLQLSLQWSGGAETVRLEAGDSLQCILGDKE